MSVTSLASVLPDEATKVVGSTDSMVSSAPVSSIHSPSSVRKVSGTGHKFPASSISQTASFTSMDLTKGVSSTIYGSLTTVASFTRASVSVTGSPSSSVSASFASEATGASATRGTRTNVVSPDVSTLTRSTSLLASSSGTSAPDVTSMTIAQTTASLESSSAFSSSIRKLISSTSVPESLSSSLISPDSGNSPSPEGLDNGPESNSGEGSNSINNFGNSSNDESEPGYNSNDGSTSGDEIGGLESSIPEADNSLGGNAADSNEASTRDADSQVTGISQSVAAAYTKFDSTTLTISTSKSPNMASYSVISYDGGVTIQIPTILSALALFLSIFL
ncbi:hypothetical protein HYPBUDRAFT_153701 [Hyphopichia burtonii NRRL Y-1933]|uniref:Uncharacterized protein n=1 Tax=Hyphopichia burtonii NRRL Y-1933 TaxID=984485 RepID=A0A1E4RG71_9ASCO|nr:hypothetical protein HYPBUDRAFT_153701 [Hyphopichia burtonii NRRL Y-1933]ODV66259.1 hypothetical protein HYPBUDRAFT_153701 [Hyphopichia burtonii NRRL Y-1933]